MTLQWPELYSSSTRAMAKPPTFLALASRQDIISFAGGVPDPGVFPFAEIESAFARVLADPDLRGVALQYAPSGGYLPLRSWIGEYMRSLKVAADASNVLITNGAQQALDLVAKLLIDDGDEVAITSPTFFAALDTFRIYKPSFSGVTFDKDGLRLDELDNLLRRGPKFLYLIPDNQNPTGLSLTMHERLEVVRLCRRHGVPILEDAAYESLCYDGEKLQTLASIDQELFGSGKAQAGTDDFGNVIYVNTFSKTIVPGLRVGWIAAPPNVIAKLAGLKLSADVHTSTLTQIVTHQIAEQGLRKHVLNLHSAYRARRDAMLLGLERFMPDGVKWTTPKGGLFVWLELPPSIDATELLNEAVENWKVAYVPGSLSFADGSGRNTCRLSFATVGLDRINEGLHRLGGLLKSAMARTGPTAEPAISARASHLPDGSGSPSAGNLNPPCREARNHDR